MRAANETIGARDTAIAKHLTGCRVEAHPLIFSHSPATLDEQIAQTLRNYRDQDWTALQSEKRSTCDKPMREAETGVED
jgi:hypothetical protein